MSTTGKADGAGVKTVRYAVALECSADVGPSNEIITVHVSDVQYRVPPKMNAEENTIHSQLSETLAIMAVRQCLETAFNKIAKGEMSGNGIKLVK